MSKIAESILVKAHLDARHEPLEAEYASQLQDKILTKLKEQNAVLVAHYYCDSALQKIAEISGGCVADSLEMARFGNKHTATTILVAGVKFMGETAKILNPEKRILMPTLEATCSLDLGCQIDEFDEFCNKHPERSVVVYANTSAEVKARADWVVTSSCALEIVEYLKDDGQKIIFAPDKHLGNYIAGATGADILLWDGACIVHEEFKARSLHHMRAMYPDSAILVHPESPSAVIEMADVVGSTSALIKAAETLPNKTFIVATDKGIFYKMQQLCPDKQFIAAPTAGNGATCRSCANCPWMAMNTLERTLSCLENGSNEIVVDKKIIPRALKPLKRMLDFSAKAKLKVTGNA